MGKTVMIGLTCAALLLPGLAEAQLGGFGLNDEGLYDVQPRSRSYPSDREIMEESLYPYGRRDAEIDRIERNFERQDRANAWSTCMMIDRNPAAQQRCLDGLR